MSNATAFVQARLHPFQITHSDQLTSTWRSEIQVIASFTGLLKNTQLDEQRVDLAAQAIAQHGLQPHEPQTHPHHHQGQPTWQVLFCRGKPMALGHEIKGCCEFFRMKKHQTNADHGCANGPGKSLRRQWLPYRACPSGQKARQPNGRGKISRFDTHAEPVVSG